MGVAIPIIGLGLSAVGTVAQVSAQNRQNQAQQDALTAQAMEAKDRLKLGEAHFQSTQLYARQMRDRELALLDAQNTFQLEQQKAMEVEQQTQVDSAKLQGDIMTQQADQQANQMLTQANQESAGLYAANRDELTQYAQVLGKTQEGQALLRAMFAGNTSGVAMPGSGTNLALEDAQLGDLIDAFQAVMGNVNTRRASADRNTEYASQVAGIQKQMGQLGGEYVKSTADRQAEMYKTGNEYQRQILDIQNRRNKAATEAEYNSAAASANMAQLSNIISERSNLASIEAQRRAIGGNGFLSFVQGATGLLSQAAPLFARPTVQQQQYSPPPTPSWQYSNPSSNNYTGASNYSVYSGGSTFRGY